MTGREIAEALGVSYIVDGSIQRSSNRIRINVRLVDTKNDVQVWSERFDREIEDVLVLQGEVAATVAATIGGRVEATRARQRIDSNGVKSYDRLLQALALYYKVSRDACEKAQHLLEEALSIEPDNARANVLLAAVHSMMSWSFWAEDNDEAQRLSVEFGRKSIELDDTDSLAHALFAEILFDDGQNELAEFHFQRALSLNPNDIAARSLYAAKLSAMGRAAEGLEHLRVAEELDPFGHFWISWIKGSVLFAARRYDEAIDVLQAISVPPNEARAILAAALARVGRTDEAKEQVTGFLEQAKQDMPDYPGDGLAEWIPVLARMYDLKDPADFEHLIDSFREAGWA
jgi:adenylate cyclase